MLNEEDVPDWVFFMIGQLLDFSQIVYGSTPNIQVQCEVKKNHWSHLQMNVDILLPLPFYIIMAH